METIWCLFSIANDYDQPSDNLVAWWPRQPNTLQLTNALLEDGVHNPNKDLVEQVWSGVATRVTDFAIQNGGTEYRLRESKAHS